MSRSRLPQGWGDNQFGELGDGGTEFNSHVPVAVSGITNATQISSGADHACAVLRGGSVECWGDNNMGDLGNGTTTPSNVPVAVSGIAGATQVVAGVAESCALLANGAIDCWGWNTYGQLGDGNAGGPSNAPVAVSGITNAVQVVLGNTHACALLADKSVECWGDNSLGQLGDGQTSAQQPYSTTPVPVTGISNAAQIAAGGATSCAFLTTGSIECWGDNNSGQLGDGQTSAQQPNSTTPVAVSGIP